MRPQNFFGKLKQLSNLPWSCWAPFIRGWKQRHKTGYVPCAFPGSRRLIEVPLRAFYQSYEFCCESRQGLQEMKFFLEKVRRGDVLYDVGAYYGAFGAAAKAAYGDEVQVHSFEPVEKNLARISEIYERNRFRAFTLVGKAVGSGAAILGAVDTFDGMLRRRDGMLQDIGAASESSAQFPSTTIDAYSAAAGFPPTLLKIDVEGFEYDVLDGAKETLRRHKPRIWLELHPTFLSEQGRDWSDLVKMIKLLGYRVTFFRDFNSANKAISFHIWCEA